MSPINVGLCAGCAHVQVMRSDRGSVFYRCQRSDTDARFPKYPRLPVVRCEGYEGGLNRGESVTHQVVHERD